MLRGMAYALSVCVDASCDGQVAAYAIGADGTLRPTGAAVLTGGHVNPVLMLTDGPGSAAYLLTNRMGVDTNQGAAFQYAIDATGALSPGMPASVAVASGAVAAST